MSFVAPVLAHPFTGGPTSPAQVAIAIGGAAAALAGVVLMLRHRRESSSEAPLSRKRRAGILLAAGGFIAFMVGPDLIAPVGPACLEADGRVSLRIVRPSEGDRLAAGDVTVEVDLVGGSIGSPGASRRVAGEGQLHIRVDGQVASITGTEEQSLDLASGRHTVEVEYVGNDHTPFCNPVIDRVRFDVVD